MKPNKKNLQSAVSSWVMSGSWEERASSFRSCTLSGPCQLHYYTQKPSLPNSLPSFPGWSPRSPISRHLSSASVLFAQIDHPPAAGRCFWAVSLSRRRRMPAAPARETAVHNFLFSFCLRRFFFLRLTATQLPLIFL